MTVYLDRRFRQIGRIKKAAGTEHKKTIRQLDEMLTGLFERGRLDILRSIQKGQYTPLQVWEYYRIGELHKLPTAATLSPLEASMKDWIADRECSEAHRRSLSQSLRHLMSVGGKASSIGDLPELLRLLRPKLKEAKHPRSFNLAKAACQAYLKSTLTKASPLYFEVMAVESLRVTPQRKKTPLTPQQFDALIPKLSPAAGTAARAMFYAGMGWAEYTGKWEVLSDRIVIHGEKRKGRERIVPLILRISDWQLSYKQFLQELSTNGIKPYDLRRSFANCLEAAGVPRIRRRMYLGHGAKDVTDLYEWHEVTQFLAEDAERIRTYLVNARRNLAPELALEA